MCEDLGYILFVNPELWTRGVREPLVEMLLKMFAINICACFNPFYVARASLFLYPQKIFENLWCFDGV